MGRRGGMGISRGGEVGPGAGGGGRLWECCVGYPMMFFDFMKEWILLL